MNLSIFSEEHNRTLNITLIMFMFGGSLAGCSTHKLEQAFIPSSTLIAIPQISETTTKAVYPEISLSQTILPTSTAIPTPEPIGCLHPPDDYSRLQVNGHWLSQRTLFMLQHAFNLYEGAIDIKERAITQGHYTDEDPLSFGTHSGGGVIDISVIDHSTWLVMYEEIDSLIVALRRAGFAAWLRDFDELNPGSPIHIHAVAIGDRELSAAAREQLIGQYGYFRGYNGIPQQSGKPLASTNGELIICSWMLELGFQDLRSQ